MAEVGFGVIGAGTWGQLHAKVYATTPGARLAAICDADIERARRVGCACGEPEVYEDYRGLLANPDVAAVSVALPDFLHRDAAVAAANPPTTTSSVSDRRQRSPRSFPWPGRPGGGG